MRSYSDIAPHFLGKAAHFLESTALEPTETILDIGCGTGNVGITAARRGTNVTGLDLIPAMLDEACENASIAGVETIDWREGTATDLPFEDGAFDVTLSCLGHMFAEPPDTAARELLREIRPGGRIVFASWTPESVVPAMGAVLSEYLPPDPDAADSPLLWGDPDVVRGRLGDDLEDLSFETDTVLTHVLSPAHYWEHAKTESGMFIVALENIDEEDQPALWEGMIDTIEDYYDDSENGVPMKYRLTTCSRR